MVNHLLLENESIPDRKLLNGQDKIYHNNNLEIRDKIVVIGSVYVLLISAAHGS